jgi:hypothetical protein
MLCMHADVRASVQRLYVPTGVQRYYFLFGRPIEVPPELVEDRAGAQRVYRRVRRGVEDCVTYLLEAREHDPFRSTPKRLLHERTTGQQAPSFDPQSPACVAEASKLQL